MYDGDHDEKLTEEVRKPVICCKGCIPHFALQDMNRYISEFLDTIPAIRDYLLDNPFFRNVYVLTIVRKFFFFLDPLGRGAVSHMHSFPFLDRFLTGARLHSYCRSGNEPPF